MKTNKHTDILTKHMEYAVSTTRVEIEIIENDLTEYDYHRQMEINEEQCDMYLVRC